VYANYDTKSTILYRAEAGTIYAIIDSTEKNHWIKIKYVDRQTAELKEGWINEGLLEAPPYLYSADDELQSYEHQGESLLELSGDNSAPATNPIGYVLCESLSLRENPSVDAPVKTTLGYAAVFEVLGDAHGWLGIRYDDSTTSYFGWVISDYVLINPKYLTTTQGTPAYAYASTAAKRVGLISAGTQLPIIAEVDGFYAVSLRAACAFVAK